MKRILNKIKMQSQRSRSVGSIVAVTLMVFLLWCLLEGSLSIASFGKHFFMGEAQDQTLSEHLLFERDGQLGWVPRENLKVANAYGGQIKVTTNARGLRETSQGSGEGPIVLCSGDSFTFGEKVADSDVWCGSPLEKGGSWRTLNAGVSGYGLDQVYLRFQKLSVDYQIHLVAIILDDLTRMKSQRSPFGPLKPKLSMTEGKLVTHRQWMDWPAPIRWLLRRGKAVRRLPSMGWLLPSLGPFAASHEQWSEIFDVTQEIFKDFRVDAQRKKSKLGVLIFPTFHDLLHRSQSMERKKLLSLLQDLEVDSLDFFPLLAELPLDHLQKLYLSDGHLSAEGHLWVSQRIISFVQILSPLN